jgi:hypothetical protein
MKDASGNIPCIQNLIYENNIIIPHVHVHVHVPVPVQVVNLSHPVCVLHLVFVV